MPGRGEMAAQRLVYDGRGRVSDITSPPPLPLALLLPLLREANYKEGEETYKREVRQTRPKVTQGTFSGLI